MEMIKKHPALCLGLGIFILFLILSLIKIRFLETLEYKLYDLMMNLKSTAEHTDNIVIVDIDDDSVDRIGRWPWQRSIIAKGLDTIQKGEPRIIGLNILYSEPEDAQGLKQINRLADLLESEEDPQSRRILRALQLAREELDNDRKLADAIRRTENVILPVFLKSGRYAVSDKTAEKDLVPYAIRNIRNTEAAGLVPASDTIVKPIPDYLAAADGIGHVNVEKEVDGVVRRNQILYRYRDLYLPSFPLKLAAAYLNLPNTRLQANLGISMEMGGLNTVPLTPDSQVLISFKGSEGAFKTCSFYEVLENRIPLSLFKDKIVLISPSASGIYNPLSTPMGGRMSVSEFTANVIWTLINQQFIRQPPWQSQLGIGLIVAVGILIALLLPRMTALPAGITFVGMLILMVWGTIHLFLSQGIWIQIIYPFLELVLGYIGVVTINYFVTESGKHKIEGESADTNRMLGLSFQNQGMLDMAFDKFRKVPVTDETKDLLYNLALDYERKRQYNKAASVYEYIEKHDPDYRDIAPKKRKLLQASDTMIYGNGFLGGGDDSMISMDTGTRPTLGRYEIIRQLGKGAMGIVYLGQDPRINRTTAIKTFRFTDDFEPEEADKLKERFFREAESAGTLSHPNIVTIYDAGDEGDLAYIAMEYLEGETFQKYTKKRNLLPMRKVIEYVADMADALDYAHQKGIVHRDIKPANVMLINNDQVKITDFGIARITATSQTQTGVVKGTPHYMSPEQISGKKVDGRSDIFSLGALLFQLLTGELPFRGDSPASLMHKIMHVPHPNPREINPAILKPLVAIIDKALEKDRNKRYQKAEQMAKHLKVLGAKIDQVRATRQKAT